MKRFTDTNKWRDPWFRRLTPTAKLLFQWLVDNCDNSGVIDFDSESASFEIGAPIKPSHLSELGDRLKAIPNGKLLVAKFVKFQFGQLSKESRVHNSVIKIIESHGLQYPIDTLSIPYVKETGGSDTPKDKDKDKDKDKEGGCGGKPARRWPTIEECKLAGAKAGLPDSEAVKFFNYYESKGWMVGKTPMISVPHAMANWKSKYEEYRSPQLKIPNQPTLDQITNDSL